MKPNRFQPFKMCTSITLLFVFRPNLLFHVTALANTSRLAGVANITEPSHRHMCSENLIVINKCNNIITWTKCWRQILNHKPIELETGSRQEFMFHIRWMSHDNLQNDIDNNISKL